MKLAAALVVAVSLLGPALQSPVPVTSEPRHHLKLENEYVRVFDVNVPPGDTTLFHIHSNDYLSVSIGDAKLKAEVLGNAPADLVMKDGEVRFTKATITHRVTNAGPAPFRNITVEVLKSPPAPGNSLTVETIPGHTSVLENDRVRVERLILEPGQSVAMHTHFFSGLGVIVSGGKIVQQSPGARPQTIEFKSGDFRWHTGPVIHSIKNVGRTRFEAVDIEWKYQH